MEMLKVQEVEQAAVVVDEEKEEEEEKEKTILYGCSTQAQGQQEGKEEEKTTLYGRTPPQTTNSTPRQRQSESFRKLLDDMGIWVPFTRPRFAGYVWQPMRMAA